MAEEEKTTSETAEQTASPEVKPTNLNPKSKWPMLVIGLLLLLLIPLGGYFLYTQFGSSKAVPSPTPTPSQTACAQDAKECPDGSFVSRTGPNCEFAKCPSEDQTAEWKTYTSAEHGWQIDYPPDFKLTKYTADQIGKSGVGEVVVFSFLGPTQKEGTEFYDGISFSIGVKERASGQTLKDFADKDSEIDPELGSKTPLKTITINGLSGFETTITGLGKFRSIYLQHPKEPNQAYYISIFAEGPGQSGAEYKKTVEKMLEGFRDVL